MLGEAVVREAAQLAQPTGRQAVHVAFLRGLARDGFVLVPGSHDSSVSIRTALPNQIQLPQTDDEVHHLLKHFRFNTPLGHLDQAIDAYARGDWAACNGQVRTFLESLLDDIARNIRPQEAAQLPSSENRRALLADAGFLAADRNEWTPDGKNYINASVQDAAHPRLSPGLVRRGPQHVSPASCACDCRHAAAASAPPELRSTMPHTALGFQQRAKIKKVSNKASKKLEAFDKISDISMADREGRLLVGIDFVTHAVGQE